MLHQGMTRDIQAHRRALIQAAKFAIRDVYDAIVELITNSDAILVLNYDKKGVKNYIGGNSLMEMGFAHVHNKKVFLLNSAPELSYTDEINAMTDMVVNGNLRNIA